ncbi:hypothetical protein, partial [Micromonospora coerulea]|uniref:hypothetical protein n=1 Tax=Micromonospora coerulea TaxID=47856 RepID=UPI0031F928F9
MSRNGTFEVRWWWRDRPVRVAVTERAALPAARRAVAGRLAALRTPRRSWPRCCPPPAARCRSARCCGTWWRWRSAR